MVKHSILAFVLSTLAFWGQAQTEDVQKGTPGPAPVIRIRSTPSVTATGPLVIVDKFVTDMKSMILAPDNIESMTILKNISATSLYGSKGADGVIPIKTKPGTEFYTINDFVNAEKNPGVQKVKLNDTVLPDMKKLLVEKKALKQTTLSSALSLDETCKAVSQDMLVVTTDSGK